MSECVVRMDEPKSCWGCPCTSIERGILFCVADGDRRKCTMDFRPKWCPIIAVLPDRHGRLVDADALINQWATVPDKLAAGAGENKWVADMVMGIQGHFIEGIIKSLEDAPTIVPADTAERS